jgi:hypothetical protein
MKLRLNALHGGAYTQLTISGPMPTNPQRGHLRRLFEMLSFWGGAPVDVVLCVGMDTAPWMEIWDEALMGVPARQLSIRFLINRGTLTGGNGATTP